MLGRVDYATALADLTEISSQIETAAIFGSDGPAHASTLGEGPEGERLVATARELLEAAAGIPLRSGQMLTQVEIALREGSVFVVRDGESAIVATTTPDPTAGLVLYDLRSCLRAAAAASAKPKPRRRRAKKKTADA